MGSTVDLVAVLRRLAPRLEAMFRRFGVAPSEATEILDEAVLEVQLRASRTPDCEGRLLRAVERGCRERLTERRRRALAALDAPRHDPGGRGRFDDESDS